MLHETLESGIAHERSEKSSGFNPVGEEANLHDDRSRPESPDLRPCGVSRKR